jgi:hypothetical protein
MVFVKKRKTYATTNQHGAVERGYGTRRSKTSYATIK